MGRRQTKQKYHAIVELQRRLGNVTDEEAASLKLMFSRCQTPGETVEVAKVLDRFCNPVDRYAVIMQTEDWFEGNDAIPCGR